MKLNKKTRIIGLSVILAAVIAAGIGMILWMPKAVKDDEKLEKTDPNVELVAEMEKKFTFVPFEPRYVEGNSGLAIVDFTGKAAAILGSNILDLETGGTLYSIQKDVSTIAKQWYKLCLNDDGSCGLVYLDDSDNVCVQQYDSTGAPTGDLILLNEFAGSKGSNSVATFRMDASNIYLLSNSESSGRQFQAFDRKGALLYTLDRVSRFEIDGNGKLYTIAPQGFMKVDAVSGEIDYAIKTDDIPVRLCLNREKDMLYTMSATEINCYSTENGDYVEQVFDFVKHSKISDATTLEAFWVDERGSVYFADHEIKDGGYKRLIYMYEYGGETQKKNIPYTLTISEPFPSPFMQEAIVRYEQENPDQRIKYNCAANSRQEYYEAISDYQSKLTLNLLAGDAGDIVMTGGANTDVYQLLITDVFVDLKPLIEKDPSYKNLDAVVLNGITIDGKIRGLPIAGCYIYPQVNAALCEKLGLDIDWQNIKWSELLKLPKVIEGKNSDVKLFGSQSGEAVFVRMIEANIPQLLNLQNRTMDLRQQWFLDLIEQWKQAKTSKNFIKVENGDMPTADTLVYMYGRTENRWEADRAGDYERYNAVEGQQEALIPMISGEKAANRVAYSADMYSITGASKNKEQAWRFLNFLLQEDIQGIYPMINVPINLKTRDAKLRDAVRKIELDEDSGKKYIDSMNEIYNSVDYFYTVGYYKMDLYLPLWDYINGKITLDDALKTAEHDIWIRLNE